MGLRPATVLPSAATSLPPFRSLHTLTQGRRRRRHWGLAFKLHLRRRPLAQNQSEDTLLTRERKMRGGMGEGK